MDPMKIRVLFIERNLENSTLVRLLLEPNANIRFRQVKDLEKAAEYLQEEAADVILVDLELPEPEVVTMLAETIQVAGEIPIVAIVGPDITRPMLLTVRSGVGDYLIRTRLNQSDLTEAMFRQTRRRQPIPKEPTAASFFQTLRVLVVEDNPGDAALIRQTLHSVKRTRFAIVHAMKLSSALECIRPPLDVILLDLNLPDSQDLETLHRVRAEDPHIPIIIVTGIEDRMKAVEALANGAQDYLVKGHVDAHLLARAILRSVQVRRPGQRAGSLNG